MSELDNEETKSTRENDEDLELKLAATSALSGLATQLNRNNNVNYPINESDDVGCFSIEEINLARARPSATPEKPYGLEN
jgi:hypothetical protein